MFLNIIAGGNSSETRKLQSVCNKFQGLLGYNNSFYNSVDDKMQSARDGNVLEDNFITPVSSSGDLMAMSPRSSSSRNEIGTEFLIGTQFEDICDVTMQEIPNNNDIFIDSSNIDYLRYAGSNKNPIDGSKESLLVKFDPLYSRRLLDSLNSPRSLTSTNERDVGYDTGSTVSTIDDQVVTPKKSVSVDGMPFNMGKDKPTQRVLPAVKQDIENNTSIPHVPPTLVRSVSAIMTTPRVPINRLINITGNTPPTTSEEQQDHLNSQQISHLQSLRIILQKQEHEIMQLRQENREIRSTLQDTEHKLARAQEDLDVKTKKWTEERDSSREKENKLLQQINEKIMSNKQMSIVMEEYEKTISTLIGEQQRDKIQFQEVQEQLTSERDEALKHLSNMESSFNDLLSKYEKSKSVIIEFKERDKALQDKIKEYDDSIKKYESLYVELKTHTTEKLNEANEYLDNMKKTHSNEIAKLNATIKKNELNMMSLQESLTQKIRENEELTKICDQLINSVN